MVSEDVIGGHIISKRGGGGTTHGVTPRRSTDDWRKRQHHVQGHDYVRPEAKKPPHKTLIFKPFLQNFGIRVRESIGSWFLERGIYYRIDSNGSEFAHRS